MAGPKQAKYRGSLGRTRSESVHYRCPDGEVVTVEVFTTIDISTDAELGERLLAGTLNVATASDGERHPVAMPILYHDPERALFALVLPEALRHRELEERAELLKKIAEQSDPAPDYVANFVTVFGAAGLTKLVAERDASAATERKLQQDLSELEERGRRLDETGESLRELDKQLRQREQALADREHALDRRAEDLAEQKRVLDQRSEALDRRAAAVERRSVDLARRAAGDSPVNPRDLEPTAPTARLRPEDLLTEEEDAPAMSPASAAREVSISVSDIEIASEPAYDDAATQRRSRPDLALDAWLSSDEDTLVAFDIAHRPRFAVAADEELATSLLSPDLQVKLQLQSTEHFPVPSLSLGAEGAMESATHGVWSIDFDVEHAAHREVLDALAEEFQFTLEVFDADKSHLGSRRVTADLSENVAEILREATAILESIAPEKRSYAGALRAIRTPGFDRFATTHKDRDVFRDDVLRHLGRPGDVLRALAVARRFSKPEREKYLIFTRGYSLARWRQAQRAVIRRAIELGLWVGPRLATAAVRDELTESREALVTQLLRNFGELIADGGHGLPDKAIRENLAALREEAATLGVGRVAPKSSPIHSAEAPAVSGTIGDGGETAVMAKQAVASDATWARLDSKDERLQAALELIDRGDPKSLPYLMRSVGDMTRSEAGRVLGGIVRFQSDAIPYLIEGLESRKAFIRQGCALALGYLGGERAIDALCDILVTEPTEIWREVARAIGLIGAGAAAKVVAHIRSHRDKEERAAWALANIAVGDGARVVESLARGRDPLGAQIATSAQDLAGRAREEDQLLRARDSAREITVNRAFSRRFFEALGARDRAAAGGRKESSGAMLLDDDDLLDITDLDDDTGEVSSNGRLAP